MAAPPGCERYCPALAVSVNVQQSGILSSMEDPELLILDKPMNGPDKDGMAEMLKLFLRLTEQRKTILIASHNPDNTRILCDTLHEMDAGMTARKIIP